MNRDCVIRETLETTQGDGLTQEMLMSQIYVLGTGKSHGFNNLGSDLGKAGSLVC